MLRLFEIDSPNVLVLLQQRVELAPIERYTLLILCQRTHQEAAFESFLVKLVGELGLDLVCFLLELVEVSIDFSSKVDERVQ